MPAWAIGGSALLGAGVSLAGGIFGQNAAKDAASSQQQGLFAGLQAQRSTTQQMLQYFDPFRQNALGAGSALTSELYAPSQQLSQAQNTMTDLQGKLTALQKQRKGYEIGTGVPVLTGKNASEKRKPIWDQMIADNEAQQAEIQTQLEQTKQQVNQAQQNVNNPNYLSDLIEKNPMFTAGANVVGRRLAAQGLQGSQEAIRQEGTLAAGVFQNQVGNQLGIYQPGAQMTGQMASNIMQSGQAQAKTLGNIGQAQAQGIMGANQALWNGIQGASNSVSQAGGTMLNYDMYNKLINSMGHKNTGATASTGANISPGFTQSAGNYSGFNANNFGMGY